MVQRNSPQNEFLEAHCLSDGSFAWDVYVPEGGSAAPMTVEGLREGRQYLDVLDPVGMKERLEKLSLSNWLLCIDKALEKSGHTRKDVDYLATLLVKRSAHDYLVEQLGISPEKTRYLAEFGHHGQNDQILSLELALEENRIKNGDLVLMMFRRHRVCLGRGHVEMGAFRIGENRMIYGDWIGRAGRSFPDKEALVDAITGRRFTYGQMAEETNRLAGFLANRLGIEKGDRVACLSFNRAEYIFLFFAVSRLGAILTPLNFRLAPAEFEYFFKDASPKALFFDHDHMKTVAEIKKPYTSGSLRLL